MPSLGWHHRALTGQPKCFSTYLDFFSQRLICALYIYDPEQLEAKEEHPLANLILLTDNLHQPRLPLSC